MEVVLQNILNLGQCIKMSKYTTTQYLLTFDMVQQNEKEGLLCNRSPIYIFGQLVLYYSLEWQQLAIDK